MTEGMEATISTVPEDKPVRHVASMTIDKEIDQGTMGTIGSEFVLAHPLADYYEVYFEIGQIEFFEKAEGGEQ